MIRKERNGEEGAVELPPKKKEDCAKQIIKTKQKKGLLGRGSAYVL